jgi:hypothetical protein
MGIGGLPIELVAQPVTSRTRRRTVARIDFISFVRFSEFLVDKNRLTGKRRGGYAILSMESL